MFSISQFIENNEIILQETLVDKVFELVDNNLLEKNLGNTNLLNIKKDFNNYYNIIF
jgi:hypothetical protein